MDMPDLILYKLHVLSILYQMLFKEGTEVAAPAEGGYHHSFVWCALEDSPFHCTRDLQTLLNRVIAQ